jgi:hypothetical protein
MTKKNRARGKRLHDPNDTHKSRFFAI